MAVLGNGNKRAILLVVFDLIFIVRTWASRRLFPSPTLHQHHALDSGLDSRRPTVRFKSMPPKISIPGYLLANDIGQRGSRFVVIISTPGRA